MIISGPSCGQRPASGINPRGRALGCGDQTIQVNNVSDDSGKVWLELQKAELLRLPVRKGGMELELSMIYCRQEGNSR